MDIIYYLKVYTFFSEVISRCVCAVGTLHKRVIQVSCILNMQVEYIFEDL